MSQIDLRKYYLKLAYILDCIHHHKGFDIYNKAIVTNKFCCVFFKVTGYSVLALGS